MDCFTLVLLQLLHGLDYQKGKPVTGRGAVPINITFISVHAVSFPVLSLDLYLNFRGINTD